MSKGSLTPHGLVVEARFYEDIGDALYQGAAAVLDAAGVTHERGAVPGAFEIPAAIRMAVRSMDFLAGRHRLAGSVARSHVIRGGTTRSDARRVRKGCDSPCGYGGESCPKNKK